MTRAHSHHSPKIQPEPVVLGKQSMIYSEMPQKYYPLPKLWDSIHSLCMHHNLDTLPHGWKLHTNYRDRASRDACMVHVRYTYLHGMRLEWLAYDCPIPQVIQTVFSSTHIPRMYGLGKQVFFRLHKSL